MAVIPQEQALVATDAGPIAPIPPSAAEPPFGGVAGESRMPLLAHLQELRRRLLWSFGSLAAASMVAFAYAPELFGLVQWPLSGIANAKMVVLSPLEMFATYLKLSISAGILVSAPVFLWQLWQFVAPGLYPHERRLAVPFVLVGSGCFLGGAAFCFFLVLPASFRYLVEMVPSTVEAHYSVALYFTLVIQLVLAFGGVFELPLVMMVLGLSGIVSAERFVSFRKYWIVLATVIGGVITPTPDPMTQLMMAVPLWAFYELGIVGIRMLRRRRARVGL